MIPQLERYARTLFRGYVEADDFPCLGAKSAFARGAYHIGVYGHLAHPSSGSFLAADLRYFRKAMAESTQEHGPRTFVAIFIEGGVLDFATSLWVQLRLLSLLDEGTWAEGYSPDPGSKDFAFSFDGNPYFVAGLCPTHARIARRFTFPTLVFNTHIQFQELRAGGNFERLSHMIRARDLLLDGTANSVLAHHGTVSEAVQYAGTLPDPDLLIPFGAAPPLPLLSHDLQKDDS